MPIKSEEQEVRTTYCFMGCHEYIIYCPHLNMGQELV